MDESEGRRLVVIRVVELGKYVNEFRQYSELWNNHEHVMYVNETEKKSQKNVNTVMESDISKKKSRNQSISQLE